MCIGWFVFGCLLTASKSDQSPTSQITKSKPAGSSRTCGSVVALFGSVVAAFKSDQPPTSQIYTVQAR